MKRTILSCLGLMLMLSSCVKKPAPVPVGEAKVRFTNAALGSSAQDCYVNSQKKNNGGLIYGASSNSITITSGDNSFVFTDEGSTTINEGTGGTIQIGASYSIFYLKTQLQQPAAVGLMEDNAVVAGKAKVRFLHFNSFLNASVAIKNQAGETLTAGVGFASSTPYYTVEPGTKFTLTATGVTTVPVVDAGLLAGKNYTIWLSGPSATELTYYTITQN